MKLLTKEKKSPRFIVRDRITGESASYEYLESVAFAFSYIQTYYKHPAEIIDTVTGKHFFGGVSHV